MSLALIFLFTISAIWSQEINLESDPYFAQRLKMQLMKNRYAEEKAKYLARQKVKNTTSEPVKKTPSHQTSQLKHTQFMFQLKKLGFRIKDGVLFDGMNPKWFEFLPKVRNAFGTFVPWVTSGTDGKNHQQGKYSHYSGYKIDIRVKNIPGVNIRDKKIVTGKSKINKYVMKLNKIKGITAILEEGKTYPHIDILLEAKIPIKN